MLGHTTSLCSKDPICLRRVPALVAEQEGLVFLLKECLEHGREKVLLEEDPQYYKKRLDFAIPGQIPKGGFSNKVEHGCPYDCGLCTDHQQHSCVTLVEITEGCNMTCPDCFTSSSPQTMFHIPIDIVKKRLDVAVQKEESPDVLQISGGEPTIHPNFFDILDEARKRPIKHLMLNTNGKYIAERKGFAEKLATYGPEDFEVYLQFDSQNPVSLIKIRGEDVTKVRKIALEKLNSLGISTNLVVLVEKGINDNELGSIIDYAVQQPCVRGVTFQPKEAAGRTIPFDPVQDRITISGVRNRILEQTSLFTSDDIIPIPCNPDSLAMAYAIKLKGRITPVSRYIKPADFLTNPQSTIIYENNNLMVKRLSDRLYHSDSEQSCCKLTTVLRNLFRTSESLKDAARDYKELLCCLPHVIAPKMKYENIFRLTIVGFMDVYNFTVERAKRLCVTVAKEDGSMIPLDLNNIAYRYPDKLRRINELQQEAQLCGKWW